MHIILRYPDGSRVQALLLSEGSDRIRVAIPGKGDTLEFHRMNERWVDEDGHKVSIEAMVFGRYASGPTADQAQVSPAADSHREPNGSSAPGRLRCTASG